MAQAANLDGTHKNAFKIGRDGPQVKNDSGVLAARNDADDGYVNLAAADPSSAEHVVTKSYGDANYNAAGAKRTIIKTLNTTASQSSSTQLPTGAVVTKVHMKVTTAYDNGATLQVGVTGTPDAFAGTTAFNLAETGDYILDDFSAALGSAANVLATLGNSPTVGAGTLLVEYCVPQA